MIKRVEKNLPELLSFFALPKHLWRKLQTTNVIERCFVEVRRRTRPMVCFVNVQSVDGITFPFFCRFNGDWKDRTLQVFTSHSAVREQLPTELQVISCLRSRATSSERRRTRDLSNLLCLMFKV
jgi:hypothetical protein